MIMKVQYILFAVATLVVFTACAKNTEQAEPEGIQMTIRAYHEGAMETKTAVLDGGTKVYWEPSDKIKVFYKGVGGLFESQNTELAEAADFSGSLNILVGFNEGSDANYNIWGVYPFRSDATSDGFSVTTTLPFRQSACAGSFAKNTHITLASSASLNMGFYNVTGGVRFSLSQEGIKSVKFEGNNGEAIAGKVKLAFSDGVPVVQQVIEPESAIILSAPIGDSFAPGEWYYIEALPGTLSGGFKMTFYKSTESAALTSSSAVSIKRGVYGSITNADAGLAFAEDGDIPDFHYECVDLGLPSGIKWATCNVGATKPEEYGEYFAWGETEPKTTYDWNTYKWCKGTFNTLTKYCLSSQSNYWDGSGSPDNKTVLDPEDDAAHANWGDGWRIPTNEEWKELMNNCTWTWDNDYNGTGIPGRVVTAGNGNSIFLPAAGYWLGADLHYVGIDGNYWYSSLSTDYSYYAWAAYLYSFSTGRSGCRRCTGFTVRPVTE